jgi:integrase
MSQIPSRRGRGRPTGGSIRWADKAKTIPLGIRVTKADGSRPMIMFERGTTREEALALAPILVDRARLTVDASIKKTVAEYANDWLKEREARGVHTAKSHDRRRLARHVLPLIGPLNVRTFGRDAVESVVTDLDRKILLDEDHEDHLSWKTASNVWVLVSRMCKDMVESKQRHLRVRDDNPAEKVRPPERGETTAQQYLYPSEFLRLMECKTIDRAFRAVYAVAVYTYARSNELAALTWDDVDLDHGVIHITKSVDRETRKVKSTKSGTTRRIPIEPALRPLLDRLKRESEHRKGTSAKRVLWMPDHEDRAILLRKHLQMANVSRLELLTSAAHRRHLTFHDLRATGITWCAVRGDDPLRIKQRAGHRSFSTTERYIREAENLRAGFGTPFPELPEELTGFSVPISVLRPPDTTAQPNLAGSEWSNGGSNPGPLHCERSALPAELLPRDRGPEHTPRLSQVKEATHGAAVGAGRSAPP